MKISIKLPNGKVETQSFNQPLVTIGRSTKNDFVVPDESLSRQHCQIELSDGEFFITDLGSANGVFLDGQRIEANTRTPFTTFLQLTIGPLECQVSDVDDTYARLSMPTGGTKSSSQIENTDSVPTKAARKVNAAALNKPFKDLKVKDTGKKNKGTSPLLPVVAVALVIGAGVYHFVLKEDASEQVKPTAELIVEKNVPPHLRDVKDDFLAEGDYLALEADKTCQGQEALCKDMKLSPEDGEGLVVKEKEIYVFFQPKRHMDDPAIKAPIKESSEAPEIVALYFLLKSPLFKEFQQKKFAQVHLLLKNEEFKTYKAFRFHTKYYTSNEQIRMLSEIGSALETGNTKAFWEYATPLIKSRDF